MKYVNCIKLRTVSVMLLGSVIYACASVAPQRPAPAASSIPAAETKLEQIKQQNEPERKKLKTEQDELLKRSPAKQKSAPAAAPQVRESVVPKLEVMEESGIGGAVMDEGGIGGTGNKKCQPGENANECLARP